jgi:pre-mRNA-processing factor SLU7
MPFSVSQDVKPRQNVWGVDTAEDVQLDDAKLKAALKAQEKFQEEQVELDERKRKFNSMRDTGEMTAEEMEAYRIKKARGDDPLAQMANGATNGYDYV